MMRAERHDHVVLHLNTMLEQFTHRTGRDTRELSADPRFQEAASLLTDLLGEATGIDDAEGRIGDETFIDEDER